MDSLKRGNSQARFDLFFGKVDELCSLTLAVGGGRRLNMFLPI